MLRNRRLNQLVKDSPVGVTVEELERAQWSREEVHEVFDRLEFRVLRDRLFAEVEASEPEAESGFEVDGALLDAADVPAWITAHLPTGERAGLSVAGTWARGVGDPTGLAVAASDDAAAWIDLTALTPEGEQAVGAWLEDPQRPKALHDAKGPVEALASRGWSLAGLTSDTQLAAYLVKPDQRTYHLDDLVLRQLHRELSGSAPADGQGMLDFGGDADEAAAHKEMVRATAVRDLAVVLDEQVAATGGAELLADVELPLIDVLARMERTGIAVDIEGLDDLEQDFAAKVSQAQEEAWDAIGGEHINLGSPKQLQEVLFGQLGMPKTKKTKTGWTTDADALADLFTKTGHPFLEALLRHRDAARLRVTVEGLQKSVADDGRIHTTYLQTIAATGRLSSTDPNLQNVPIRTEEGRRIRELFVVGDGFESLMSADYSQIEMRVMAHLSGDEGLIEAFRTGEDLHRFVGSKVFGVAPEDVTPAMRSKVKAMSYGLAYGLSAFGLSKQLTISTEEARGLMDGYFERFGGVSDYLKEVVAEARGTGYTATMFGRRRYLPDLTSDNRQRRETAERMALNAPIQGSAADIMKVAMIKVDRGLVASGAAFAGPAAGARRARARDRPGRAGRRRDPRAPRDGARRRDGRARSTSTSGWAAPGTTPRTDRRRALLRVSRLVTAGAEACGRRRPRSPGRAVRAAATRRPRPRHGPRATRARRGRRARAQQR